MLSLWVFGLGCCVWLVDVGVDVVGLVGFDFCEVLVRIMGEDMGGEGIGDLWLRGNPYKGLYT